MPNDLKLHRVIFFYVFQIDATCCVADQPISTNHVFSLGKGMSLIALRYVINSIPSE